MTDEMKTLATRALASKHWRWMPGMIARYNGDVTTAWYRLPEGDSFGLPSKVRPPNPRHALPDFSDAATRGCLLALVQEAHGAPVWLAPDTEPDPLDDSEHVLADRLSWLVFLARDGDYIDVIGHGRTPAAALVAALEAAP